MGSNDGADQLKRKVINLLEADAGLAHGEFLACFLKGVHQCLVYVLIHVGGHEVERVVLLLYCEANVIQGFLIVSVGIHR